MNFGAKVQDRALLFLDRCRAFDGMLCCHTGTGRSNGTTGGNGSKGYKRRP